MPKYEVCAREIVMQDSRFYVEADSPDEAKLKIMGGECVPEDSEFSELLGMEGNTMTVEEVGYA